MRTHDFESWIYGFVFGFVIGVLGTLTVVFW
jgi:hypothetical protein